MEKVKIGNYVKQIRGVSYKPNDLHNDLNSDSVILLRANNINEGKINFDDIVYVDKSKVKKEQYLKKGDILICTSSGSKELVGKAAFINKDYTVTFGAFCKLIRPKDCISEYLGHYFNSQIYKEKISSLALGANINNIRNEHIDELLIYLPNKAEQQNISMLLDEVVDLIDKRKKQLKKLDELVKSRFVEMFGNGNYPMVKAEAVCEFITKGTTPPTGEIYAEFDDNKVPYLKVYNLSFDGSLLFDSEPQYINKEIHNGKLSRSKVYPNDVLMNIVGPPLGKFSLVTAEYPEWNINQAISIFRAKKDVLPRFLLSALMQPTVLKPFLKQAVGVRQLNISLEQCRNLQFPLPPIERQNEFVIFTEQTDKSKFEIKQSLEMLELLKKALMQKYFG